MSSAPSSHNSPTPPIDRSKGTSRGGGGGGGGGLITAILAVLCVILAIVSLVVYQGKQQTKEELAKMTEAKVKVEEDLKSKTSQVDAIQRELQTRYVPISTLPSQLQGTSPSEARGKIAAMVQQLADMTPPSPATPTGAPAGGPAGAGTPSAGAPTRPGDAVSVALENVTKAVVKQSIDTKAAIGNDAAKIAMHRDIQTVLARLGSYSKPISGNQKDTMDAVMSFQKSNGLKADGVIGKGTWGKVREKLEGAPRAGAN